MSLGQIAQAIATGKIPQNLVNMLEAASTPQDIAALKAAAERYINNRPVLAQKPAQIAEENAHGGSGTVSYSVGINGSLTITMNSGHDGDVYAGEPVTVEMY